MEAIVTIGIIIGLFFILKANKWFIRPSTKNEIKSKIPEEVLDKQFDEVIDEFVKGEYSKSFPTNYLLKKGERLIFDIPNITLAEERSVGVKGGHQGFSVRIMKGVSYRFGNFSAGAEYKIVPLDEGNLILTNKRIVFSGEKASKDISLSKINTIEPMDNGIRLARAGKQKVEYYLGTNNVEFTLTVTPNEGDEGWEEESVNWYLSGGEVKNIIQKLLQE